MVCVIVEAPSVLWRHYFPRSKVAAQNSTGLIVCWFLLQARLARCCKGHCKRKKSADVRTVKGESTPVGLDPAVSWPGYRP